MRTAAFAAGALIATGIYLAVAASFTFAPTWIALGMMAIAGVTSISLTLASPTREG